MTADPDGMAVLDRADCLRHLGTHGVGRVAVTIGALPTVFPVIYAVLDGDIVFSSTAGTKLAAAVRDTVVAFEADNVVPVSRTGSRTGWSVVVVGLSRHVTDPAEIARIESNPPLEPWGGGGRCDIAVRLRSDLVTGREFAHPSGATKT